MGYNEKEFFRVLPAAIGDFQFTVAGDFVHINHPEKDHALELQLTPLPDRCLGLIRIQHIDVQFSFSNMNQNERNQFMFRFDRRFQRGGG